MADPTTHLTQLRDIYGRDGVRAALIFLNGLSAHRFTALYRFDGDTLKNLFLFDRENPAEETSPEIPVMASYCVFVRNSGARFVTHDSMNDPRAAGHPKQREVQSYCGVPLLDNDGNLFGTICMFDFGPVPISNGVVELMESLAPLLRGGTF